MKLLIAMMLFCGSALAETHSDGCNTTTCDDDRHCMSTTAYCTSKSNALTLLAPVDIHSLRLSNTVERFSCGMKPVPLMILPDGRCVVNGTIAIKDQCEIQMMIEMDKLRGEK